MTLSRCYPAKLKSAHITALTELTWKHWLQSKRASGWGNSTNDAVKQKTDLLALGTSQEEHASPCKQTHRDDGGIWGKVHMHQLTWSAVSHKSTEGLLTLFSQPKHYAWFKMLPQITFYRPPPEVCIPQVHLTRSRLDFGLLQTKLLMQKSSVINKHVLETFIH